MKHRFLLAFAVAGLAAVGLSADTSHTYGPLRDSAVFRSRVTFIITIQAPVVLAEASNVPCHGQRAALAAAVASNPVNYAGIFAAHLVTNINVTTGGALTGSGNTLDTPATDASLLAAVASQWPIVAGCITNQ
jgi:hypothetical protein